MVEKETLGRQGKTEGPPAHTREVKGGGVFPPLLGGSAGLEAGGKTVIGSRLNQSGRFWMVRGAKALLALRGGQFKHRFEDYWVDRRGHHQHFPVAHPLTGSEA